jgi:hypothetical protein
MGKESKIVVGWLLPGLSNKINHAATIVVPCGADQGELLALDPWMDVDGWTDERLSRALPSMPVGVSLAKWEKGIPVLDGL